MTNEERCSYCGHPYSRGCDKSDPDYSSDEDEYNLCHCKSCVEIYGCGFPWS